MQPTSGGSSSFCDSRSVSCLISLGGLPPPLGGLGPAGGLGCLLEERPVVPRPPLWGSGRASISSGGGVEGFSGIQKPLLVVWPMPVPCDPRSQPCMTVAAAMSAAGQLPVMSSAATQEAVNADMCMSLLTKPPGLPES